LALKPDDGRPILTANVVDLDPAVARLLVKLGVFTVLAAVALLSLPRRGDDDPRKFWNEACLVLLAMLLVSERSWKHHFTTLIVCHAVLAAAWLSYRKTEPRRATLIVGCVAFAQFAMATTSTDFLRPFFGADAAKWAQAYGAYVWAAVALFAAHAVALKRSAFPETVTNADCKHVALNSSCVTAGRQPSPV
ncbi:MAG: hypothetical protein ACRDD1_14480, partial [Planctomycetia bacterium]